MNRAAALAAALAVAPSANAAVAFDSPSAGASALWEAVRAAAAGGEGPEGAPAAQTSPLVVAVSGMEMGRIGYGLEYRHLRDAWRWLFPGREPDEAALARELASFHEELEAKGAGGGKPQNYLETDLRAAAERNGIAADVRNFRWSRDPQDTASSVAGLKAMLEALARSEPGRPVVVVSHSWGTVLAHEALARLAQEGRPAAVRGLVTLGSPLVPTRLFVRAFKELHHAVSGLQRRVAKPDGVGRWVNLWAENDPYSGPIDAADANVRVDGRVDELDVRLDAALAAGADRRAIAADKAALRHPSRWHESYRSPFRARLATLGLDVEWDVMQENLPDVLPAA